MATATMATAAGAAALLYYTVNRKLQMGTDEIDVDENGHDAIGSGLVGIERVSHRLIQAPVTWMETISTLSETLRFTYSETLGKWPIGDLAFGINFLLKRQGKLHIENVFGGKDSLRLKGPEIVAELKYLLNLLTLCWHFSKKPFPLFLDETGYTKEEVLLQEPKAGILKPAFTILVDHKSECFLLLIRGTHSIKDTLTAATGAVVPFHHTVVRAGGVSNLVLGYAHCGMVAAARWIAKLAKPCLLKALAEHSGYNLKIIGHSLGGGTAALLTFILREQKELSTTSCVAFAPAACMTWELAESGDGVITSVINGADLVPTFSAASVDDLRAEVTASAWLNDLRNQIVETRILSTVYRSASALGSRLPSIAGARAKVAGAGAVLRPVSSRTQAVMRKAQTMAHAAWTRPKLPLSWSCMGPRHRADAVKTKEGEESLQTSSPLQSKACEPLLTYPPRISTETDATELPVSTYEEPDPSPEAGCHADLDIGVTDGDGLTDHNRGGGCMSGVELWHQLEEGLYDGDEHEETVIGNEIREEEEEAAATEQMAVSARGRSACEQKEVHRFFPPGKIMHIMTLYGGARAEDSIIPCGNIENGQASESEVGIFVTQRALYSRLRLSQSVIADHLMPIYRRQIEKLIQDLEKEEEEVRVESGSVSTHGGFYDVGDEVVV